MMIKHPYRDYAIYRTLNSDDDYHEKNVPKHYYSNDGFHSYKWLFWLVFVILTISNPHWFLNIAWLVYIAFGIVFSLVHFGYAAHESAKHDKNDII